MTIEDCIPQQAVEGLRMRIALPTEQDFISQEHQLATVTPEALSHVKVPRFEVAFRAVHLAVNAAIGDSNPYADMQTSLMNADGIASAAVSPQYYPFGETWSRYGRSEVRWLRLFRPAYPAETLQLEELALDPKVPAPSVLGSDSNTYDIMRAVHLPAIDRTDEISVMSFGKHLHEDLRSPAGTYAVRKRAFFPGNARTIERYRWFGVEIAPDLSVQISEIELPGSAPAVTPESAPPAPAPTPDNDAQMPSRSGNGLRRAMRRMRLTRGTPQESLQTSQL